MTIAAIPCAGTDCFNVATHEVTPRGRWRNVSIVKACRGCAKRLAVAYRTEAGERGWADVELIAQKTKPVKAATK